jgi:curved DNA-binding protein CbpA
VSAAAGRHFAALGLEPTASASDVRAAYHRLAKRNHPDLFPDDQRSRQQLRMMRVNEAYMAALAELADRGDEARRPANAPEAPNGGGEAGGREPDGSFFRAWEEKTRTRGPSAERSVGFPRDPAYAYYKQGFRYYNLGSTELFRKEAPQIRRHLLAEGTADGYLLRLALRALHYFERSYSYFLVVAERYPASPWAADARWKLRRLDRFSAVYQRICENLSRRSSMRRSSFSIVRGAEPS